MWRFYAQNELISNLMPATGLNIVGTFLFKCKKRPNISRIRLLICLELILK